jgi:hypothetical protein
MQQLFRLLTFPIQPYIFRATNSPILRSTFWLYTQLLLQCTDTAADRCHGSGTGRQQCRCIVAKAVYTVKKCSWGWANLSPEICRAEMERLINEKVVASCSLFTSSVYVVPLSSKLTSSGEVGASSVTSATTRKHQKQLVKCVPL